MHAARVWTVCTEPKPRQGLHGLQGLHVLQALPGARTILDRAKTKQGTAAGNEQMNDTGTQQERCRHPTGEHMQAP